MKIPSSVLWQLTKKNNSFLVKYNGQTFSHDPLNLTGLHNASSSGLANDASIGLQSHVVKTKKGTRRAVTLLQKHKSHNKITKRRKNSASGLVYATQPLRRGMKRLGKIVKGLPVHSERVRKLALQRLRRLHVANRSIVKGTKNEQKK